MMGILLKIKKLKKENKILKEKLHKEKLVLERIYGKAYEYRKKNNAISYVGFAQIQDLADTGLDYIENGDKNE